MVKKNNLFELIHSLSPSEKRFFRQSIADPSHHGSNYTRLFDAIDKMDTYDEVRIRKKFKGEKFINQLHVTKIYLQDSILKSLRNYHGSSTTSIVLKNHLQNIEIYFSKELYNHCALEIQKAEKFSIKFEDDIALLEILNWKRKLSQTQSPQDFIINDILEVQTKTIERLANAHGFWIMMINGAPATEESLIAAEPQSLNAYVLSYHIQYREAIQQGKNELAKASLLKLISILETQHHRIEEEPAIYLSTINNLLSFLVFTKKIDEALSILPKVKSFYNHIDRTKRNKGNFRLILRTYNIELEIYRDTESLESAVNLIDEIEKLLSQHDKAPSSYLISLWFQYAYIFFLRRDFKSALHWINEILNASFANKRQDLHLQAYLLNLMVHLELRNFFVMRYFVDSTKRFYKRNQALRPHHKIILSFFSKVGNEPESHHRELFKQLHKDMFSMQNIIPKNELDYINWNKWIVEKINRLE